MNPWNLNETRDSVRRLFGGPQVELVSPCLDSVRERQQFARFHYHETKDILEAHIDRKLETRDVIDVILGLDDQDANDTEYALARVRAHVTACVQSIHAVADTLAHCVYYSLGINRGLNALHEREIHLNTVATYILREPGMGDLARSLVSIRSAGEFSYLAALCNHGKHRSLILPSIWGDATGRNQEPYTLRFGEFSFNGTRYPQRHVWPILQGEYDRISIGVVDTGNLLNDLLRSLLLRHSVS